MMFVGSSTKFYHFIADKNMVPGAIIVFEMEIKFDIVGFLLTPPILEKCDKI